MSIIAHVYNVIGYFENHASLCPLSVFPLQVGRGLGSMSLPAFRPSQVMPNCFVAIPTHCAFTSKDSVPSAPISLPPPQHRPNLSFYFDQHVFRPPLRTQSFQLCAIL